MRARLALAAYLAALALPAAVELAAAARCLTPTLPKPGEAAEFARTRLGAESRWVTSGDPDRSPPPDPQVGDSWSWWLFIHGTGGPHFELRTCTVRGRSDRGYVVVENTQWNVRIFQSDVDQLLERWENSSLGSWPNTGIYDLVTQNFGEAPDALDDDPRIYIMWFDFGLAADGFFFAFDEEPEGTYADLHSNECEVLYMNTNNGQSPSGDYMTSVIAHEFQHQVHWNHDADEDSWLDEGFGELAMWLFGHPDTISSFNTNPDNNLIVFDGNWADYIQTYLWSLYAYEQFGGQPFIWDVTHNTLNGMASYNAELTSHGFGFATDTVFRNWAAANFLDDTTIPNGEFGYTGDALPPFTPWRTVTTYPASGNSSVQSWAAEYMRCTGIDGVLHLDFNGQDARSFRVALLARDASLPTLVQVLSLNAQQDGSIDFTAAQDYDEVIVSVSNVASASATYTYNLSVMATPAGEAAPGATALAGAQPNPFNPKTRVHFTSASEQRLRLEIFTVSGRRLALLADAVFPAGAHARDWDGRDEAGHALPAGLYLVRLSGDGGQLDTGKLTLLK